MIYYILKYILFLFLLKPITIVLYYFVGYFFSPYVIINKKKISCGCRRNVFIHPVDNNKIIKINKENNFWNNNMENFRSYLFIPYLKHTPKNYGLINTNLGIGIQYELIRDYDSNISKTVLYYLEINKYTEEIKKQLKICFDFYSKNYDIIIEHNNERNFVVQRISENKIRLVIVDGYDTFLFTKKFYQM